MEQSDWRKRYHVLWEVKLNTFSIDFTDKEIESLPNSNKDFILENFTLFVKTENSLNISRKIINLKDIPPKMDLYVPHWVMDRLKESMRLYVEGFYFAVIMLCGSIVEFIVDGMFETYKDQLPEEQRNKPKYVMKILNKLSKNKLLHDDDYKILCYVRKIRDEHTHLHILSYDPVRLRKDALDCILELTNFFDKHNMESKYSEFLKYLYEYSRS